jgi:hypothetical protein
LIRRISPEGGGSGNVEVIDFNMPRPNFQMKRISTRPNPNQMMAEKVGMAASVMFRV